MKCGHIEYKIQLTFQDGYWKIKSATEKNHDMDKYEEPVEKTMEMFAELKSALGL